jgi:deoxyribodipyrimidine photolyase-like uncharacterized protein
MELSARVVETLQDVYPEVGENLKKVTSLSFAIGRAQLSAWVQKRRITIEEKFRKTRVVFIVSSMVKNIV